MVRCLKSILIALVFGLALAVPAGAQSVLPPAGTTNGAAPTDAAGTQTAPDSDLEALLKVLKDDTARAALIDKLEGLQATGSASGTPATDSTATPSDNAAADASATLVEEVATMTKSAAENFYAGLQSFGRDIGALPFAFSDLSPDRQDRIVSGAPALLGTIAVTLLLFYLFSVALARTFFRMPVEAEGETFWRAVMLLLVSALRDVMALLGAYLAGYLVSVGIFGAGQLAIEQSLFLNAFVIAGAIQIALGILIHPERTRFPVFRLPAEVALSLYRRLNVLFAVVVYGVVAVVPISYYWASLAAGRALRLIVISIAAVWALAAIRHIAAQLNAHAAEEDDRAAEASDGVAGHEQAVELERSAFWRALWPVIAYLYVLASWGLAIAQPALMIDLIGAATAQTLIVVVATLLILRGLGALNERGLPMPKNLHRALPPFKGRIEVLLPVLTRTFAVLAVLAALALVLDAWQLIDVADLMGRPEIRDFAYSVFSALIIVVAAIVVWAFVASFIDHRLSLNLPGRNVTARTRTLLSLFRNAFTVLMLIFVATATLSRIGLDIAPLLAGAGVAGLAIGFGAQKLVQDIITGIFIQVENAINEGDVVTVAGITGVVERLTVRSVAVRDLDGVYHIVPFSAVDTVSNFMRKFSYHVADIGVAYKERIPPVKDAMHEAFDRLKQGERGHVIVGDLEMMGVNALGDSAVVVRARIKTRPGEQWAVGRAYNEYVKEVFDERGIEIPFPHRTLVFDNALPLDRVRKDQMPPETDPS